jgi:hypothetical protein
LNLPHRLPAPPRDRNISCHATIAPVIGVERTIGTDPETEREIDPQIEAAAAHHTSPITLIKPGRKPSLPLGFPLQA